MLFLTGTLYVLITYISKLWYVATYIGILNSKNLCVSDVYGICNLHFKSWNLSMFLTLKKLCCKQPEIFPGLNQTTSGYRRKSLRSKNPETPKSGSLLVFFLSCPLISSLSSSTEGSSKQWLYRAGIWGLKISIS